MRYRGTIEQGLTFKQIFCEVYSDVVEKYVGKGYHSTYELMPGNIEHLSDEIYQKVRYLRRMIKQAVETDDEFRWLFASVPIKTNKVDKTTGKKLRPYVEYRYINIKASETPELLDELIAYWNKRIKAWADGIKKSFERAEAIAEMTSTPERKSQYEMVLGALAQEIAFRQFTDKNIEKLKREGRVPPGQCGLKYPSKLNYPTKVLRKKIMNDQSLVDIFSSLPTSSTNQWIKVVNHLMKATIKAYCDEELDLGEKLHIALKAEANAKKNAMK